MLVFKEAVKLQQFLEGQNGKSIGFVPTMGALHEGHLSLIEISNSDCSLTVASIFINPIQFNKEEDLNNYPRTIDKDLKLLESRNCDIVFLPTVDEMYANYELKEYEFGEIANVMEGEHRPGHFNGVANVIARFFDIIKPTSAYFGEKDFQQLAIVKALVAQKKYSTEIIGCPIYREENGLAMSSRNERLTSTQRENAAVIFKGLDCLKKYHQGISVSQGLTMFKEQVNAMPDFDVEYISFADGHNLQPIKEWEDTDFCVAFCAVNVGQVRLIDNMTLFN